MGVEAAFLPGGQHCWEETQACFSRLPGTSSLTLPITGKPGAREGKALARGQQVSWTGPGPYSTSRDSSEVSLMPWGCLTRLISFDLCSHPVPQVFLPHQRGSRLMRVRPCRGLVAREAEQTEAQASRPLLW